MPNVFDQHHTYSAAGVADGVLVVLLFSNVITIPYNMLVTPTLTKLSDAPAVDESRDNCFTGRGKACFVRYMHVVPVRREGRSRRESVSFLRADAAQVCNDVIFAEVFIC